MDDLEAVLGCDASDLVEVDGPAGCRLPFDHRLTHFREISFESSRDEKEKDRAMYVPGVLETVDTAPRHEDEASGTDHEVAVVVDDLYVAVQHVERLVLPAVDVERWALVGWDPRLR